MRYAVSSQIRIIASYESQGVPKALPMEILIRTEEKIL